MIHGTGATFAVRRDVSVDVVAMMTEQERIKGAKNTEQLLQIDTSYKRGKE